MTVDESLARVRRRIAEAERRAGRALGSVELVAVSKLQPVEAIRSAYRAGQRLFGESYVQELLSKRERLADLPDLGWHFIGHLQRNKARQVVGRVAVVESVDSIKLAEELAKRAEATGATVSVLAQVDVAGEETKNGCARGELGALLDAVEAAGSLRLRGLMAIPPFEVEPEEARRHFAALRELRDRHGGAERLPELSMGMSGDFEVAIEEGATLVRVGTALFGPRPMQ